MVSKRVWSGFRLASFVAFYATLLIYSPNVVPLQSLDIVEGTGLFVEPYLVCAACAALVLALASWRRSHVDQAIARRPVVVACSLVYVVANACFVLTIHGVLPWGAVGLRACGVFTGVSLVPVFAAWSRAFADVDLRGAVAVVALTMGIAAVLGIALGKLSPAPRVGVFVALLALGAAGPLASSWRGSGAADAVASSLLDAAASEVSQGNRPSSARSFLSVMGVSLLGMAISSFAIGVQPTFLFDASVDAQSLGMLVGALGLVPLAAMARRQPASVFIYQVYLPVAAAAVLIACLLPVDGWLSDAVLACVHAFYCMVSGVAIASACAIANAREFPRTYVVASLVGTYCAMAIVGISLGGRFEVLLHNSSTVLTVLTALYACGMLLSGCVKSWRLVARPLESAIPPRRDASSDGVSAAHATPVPTFDERVAALARESSLSPRETQIVAYVGRGHSSVYVAKTLLISESTVYTHVRNIYRKLGISSREELIALLSESPGAPKDPLHGSIARVEATSPNQ